MGTTLARLLFSLRGRIPRRVFIWTALCSAAAFLVLFVFLETLIARESTWILYPPFFWIVLSAAIRRLHDAGSPAGWLLVLIVPVLGPLWLGWLLVFRRGSAGENQYGDDPLAYGDYLSVDIHAPGGLK